MIESYQLNYSLQIPFYGPSFIVLADQTDILQGAAAAPHDTSYCSWRRLQEDSGVFTVVVVNSQSYLKRKE